MEEALNQINDPWIDADNDPDDADNDPDDADNDPDDADNDPDDADDDPDCADNDPDDADNDPDDADDDPDDAELVDNLDDLYRTDDGNKDQENDYLLGDIPSHPVYRKL